MVTTHWKFVTFLYENDIEIYMHTYTILSKTFFSYLQPPCNILVTFLCAALYIHTSIYEDIFENKGNM